MLKEQDSGLPNFDELKAAAQEENWELVDAHISGFCDDPAIIEWALNQGVRDEDGNIRDLAVSLIEKSTLKINDENVLALQTALDSDPNPYVQFRAAFALFTHGDRSDKVLAKLKEALQDEATREIAQGYLAHAQGEGKVSI